ncbi:MAG: hypothetical protein RLZZ522_2084 [Verrucomicrobiota bacterium]|jgi:hypothetical protein
MLTPLLRLLVPVLVLTGGASAQLATSMQLSKREYVAGESVIANVTITNHAGRDITFQGILQRPWLDFVITNNRGESATSTGRGVFGAMTIRAGETRTRQVDLATTFQLFDPGNYSASATIRMPGEGGETTVTNRVLFTVSPGRAYWSQKVGVADRVREFRILNFSGDQKANLYAQVVDGRTGLPLRTFSLGEALLLRKPSVTVDNKQRMHVLFLSTPSQWVHCQVDTDGRVVNRQIHQRGPQGDPSLATAPNGQVGVVNSILYDPKAAAARQAKFRKLSDRPAITY